MKFMVGYRTEPTDDYINEIIKNKHKISEVYFSWGDLPNGRSNNHAGSDLSHIQAMEKQMKDLKKLSENNIGLNLLLNGNCYGKHSLSRTFFEKTGDIADYIQTNYGLNSVTTTSPIIGKFIKNNFSSVEVRASVNMDIGTTEGMDYVSQYFDGFYMKREYNKNLDQIKKLRAYCNHNGKKLYMLANSGCLNHCSARTFHDNLVSHEKEISELDNAYEFQGICRDFLTHSEAKNTYLCITNFIRPEDIHLYTEYFDGIKLATRTSPVPIQIMNAYFNEKYTGSVMNLLEPNHTGIFYPYVAENSKIPNDYGQHVLNCNKACDKCDYCKNIFKSILTNLSYIGGQNDIN